MSGQIPFFKNPNFLDRRVMKSNKCLTKLIDFFFPNWRNSVQTEFATWQMIGHALSSTNFKIKKPLSLAEWLRHWSHKPKSGVQILVEVGEFFSF